MKSFAETQNLRSYHIKNNLKKLDGFGVVLAVIKNQIDTYFGMEQP